ncbi:MAG: histidine--tRNA ligase [Helicobacter sp.]|mgnify:CR=1 FL=1|nr:histidine--tRNA ligase [Helicobacter sp.]
MPEEIDQIKNQKIDRITPKTLSGFRDLLPEDAIAKGNLLKALVGVFQSFGFVPIETPHLEYTQMLLGHGSEDIKKELYRFSDHGGRDVALRFDQTVPLARFISQHKHFVQIPFKRYVIGNVFRGERAQRGRYREFTQCDFDFIGSSSIACDAEIVQVIYQSLAKLGLDDFIIWVNHRAILNGICKYFDINNEIEAVLRSIDKLSKIGIDNVKSELKKICNLSDKKIDNLLQTISIKQTTSKDSFFAQIAHMKEWNEDLKRGICDLEEMFEILEALEMDSDSYRINFSIARGLGYYTGIVYETTLGGLESLGSVCSGGRYDNLTEVFGDANLSGVGASIGLDRLIFGLKELGISEDKRTTAKVLVAYTDPKYLSFAYRLGELFRGSNINTEVYPESAKLKRQLSYADSKGHDFAIIIGQSEFESQTLTLKNMATGLQIERLSFLKSLEIIKN